MTNPDFVEVYPDAVIRAGHATTDTESLWRTWGSRIRITLEGADSSLGSAALFEHVKAYAEGVVSDANRVGQQVANLGVHTSSAGGTVAGADGDAEAVLHQQAGAVAGQGTALNRPVNH
jgi:hypothetical protein